MAAARPITNVEMNPTARMRQHLLTPVEMMETPPPVIDSSDVPDQHYVLQQYSSDSSDDEGAPPLRLVALEPRNQNLLY